MKSSPWQGAYKFPFSNIASGMLRIGYYAQSSSALYAYDAQGNRTGATTTKGEASLGLSRTSEASVYHLWADSDRIRKIDKTSVLEDGTTAQATWAYVYDALGNLSEKGDSFAEAGEHIAFSADSGHYVRYRYGLWNRLTGVEKGSMGTGSALQVASYEYDPTGLRIRKVTSNTVTEYVYGQDGNVLRETRSASSAEAVTIDYVYALGKLAAWTETASGVSTKYWATTDHLGSVTAATDANGTIAMRRDFSAFGDSKDAVLATAAGPRYTGKDYDEDSELYYFNARWYDAELARFTTEDPARDDINWYVYCANNPLTFTDPTGMAPVEGSAITNRTYYDSATKSLREKAPSPIWPTDSRRVTWEYGPTHKLGMDIGGIVAGVAGDEVRASQGGEVTTSGLPEWSPSGSSYVIVAGDDGLEYRYVHMADLEVQKGDRVEQGEPLGKMDAVGAPGGVHLHFEIREDGKAQNPRNYLPE